MKFVPILFETPLYYGLDPLSKSIFDSQSLYQNQYKVGFSGEKQSSIELSIYGFHRFLANSTLKYLYIKILLYSVNMNLKLSFTRGPPADRRTAYPTYFRDVGHRIALPPGASP